MNVRAFLASLVVVLLAVVTVGFVTGRAAEPQVAVPAPDQTQISESGWSSRPEATRPGRDLTAERHSVRTSYAPYRADAPPHTELPPGEDTNVLTKPSHIPQNDQVPSVAPGTGDLLSLPVIGPRTSRFGMRFHPILHIYKLHTGLDFAAPCGSPVGASAAGVVVRTGWAGGNGVQVVIEHGTLGGHQVRTTYNHLSSIGVKVGDRVAVHQGIGRVGSTGYSTGCHLHFEVIADGKFTDPEPWLDGKPVIIDLSSMLAVTPSVSASASPSASVSTAASPSATPSVSTPPSLTPSPSSQPASSQPATAVLSSSSPDPAPPSASVSASPSATPSSASPSPSDEPSDPQSPSSIPSPTTQSPSPNATSAAAAQSSPASVNDASSHP